MKASPLGLRRGFDYTKMNQLFDELEGADCGEDAKGQVIISEINVIVYGIALTQTSRVPRGSVG